jgi:hypothetical protein
MLASRVRVMASTFAAVGLVFALGGCSLAPTEEIPPEEKESIAIGANTSVGALEARSLLLVSTEEGAPGRVLGTIFNSTDEDIEVTIADDDDEVAVTVPARGLVALEEDSVLIESVSERPGSFVPLTLTAESADTEILVPVRDGSLEQFEPFVPAG